MVGMNKYGYGYVVDRAYNEKGLIFGGKNESKKIYVSKMV